MSSTAQGGAGGASRASSKGGERGEGGDVDVDACFESILTSTGKTPLANWDAHVRSGHIQRLRDPDLLADVLELSSKHAANTYITCPSGREDQLGVTLPFLVLVVKAMGPEFVFDVQVLDNKNLRRRFRASTHQQSTRIKPFLTSMPLRLEAGWNTVVFNLADYTRRAYGTAFVEVIRVQLHATCRLRRAYFCDRVYKDSELPRAFRPGP